MLTNQLLKFTKEAKQMKKFVVKTTKEFTYNEKGFIVKEVVTEESYEQEMYTGGTINSGTIKVNDIKADVLKKATGVAPSPYTASYEGKVDTTNVTHNVTLNTAKTITEIANEVKAILDRDLKRTPTTFI
jgi:flagellar basal body rod protein FlgC